MPPGGKFRDGFISVTVRPIVNPIDSDTPDYVKEVIDAVNLGKFPGISDDSVQSISTYINSDFPDKTIVEENRAIFEKFSKKLASKFHKRCKIDMGFGSDIGIRDIWVLPSYSELQKRIPRSKAQSKVTDKRFNAAECEAIIQLNELAKAAYTSFERDIKKEFGALIKYNHDNPNSRAMAWLIKKEWKNPFDKLLGKNDMNYISGSNASYMYLYCLEAKTQFEKYQTNYNSAIKWDDSVDSTEALDDKYGDMISDEVIKIVGEIGSKYRGYTPPWEKSTSAYKKLQILLSKIYKEGRPLLGMKVLPIYYNLYKELDHPDDDPYERFGIAGKKFIESPGGLDLDGIKWLIEKTDKYLR